MAHLDGTLNPEGIAYLMVECSTRDKKTAHKCRKLIRAGNYGRALEVGDPIAFEVGKRDFK